jgi:hypothetical protein
MNGYVCFYRGEQVEVHADTSYAAQQAAVEVLSKRFPRRKVKGGEVTVVLGEKDGQPVVHVADF